MEFDWAAFSDTLVNGITSVIREMVTDNPGERYYAAALGDVYYETGGVISLPLLGIDSISGLEERGDADEPGRRWNPADWDVYEDSWLPGAASADWERALTAHACRGSTGDWNAAFEQYLSVLAEVCHRSRALLREQKVVDDDFLVLILLLDDERYEELVRRTLTAAELERYFPFFIQRAAEMARVRSLPLPEQAEYYASRLGRFDTLIGSEEAESALRDLGPVAAPVLVSLLASGDRAWQAAKLLADIGESSEHVIRALDDAMTRCDGSDQAWAARALSRLGRLDLVLDPAGRLPEEVVVSAVAAPYSSFRDDAVRAPRLDYRPLADFIERFPQHVPALAREFAPGRGACTIESDEADEALRGLASPHAIIRSHAVNVLGERGRGPDADRKVREAAADWLDKDS